jgi:hypothetical protein
MRTTRPLIAFVLLAALASCGHDSELGIAQHWVLQTVAGGELPFTVPHATHDIVITSATANIGTDGNYTMTYMGTTDGTPGTVATDHGTWTISSSVFNFRSSTLDGQTFIAAYFTSTFRATIPGAILHSDDDTFEMVFGQAVMTEEVQ